MALTSVGTEITIIDESQYLPAAAGPVPLIIAPSAQDKTNPAGTGTATGTLAANINKVQLVTSQRELATNFGVPSFTKVSGAVVQGDELNEYGLLAAYSFLGVASKAYIMRPDVNLTELVPSSSAATGEVATGTYWLDLAETAWGLQEWNAADQVFTVVSPLLITSSAELTAGLPLPQTGSTGDYAVSIVSGAIKAYYKGGRSDLNQNWALIGTAEWKRRHATVRGTVEVTTAITDTWDLVINGTTIAVPNAPNNYLEDLVDAINANGTLNANMKAIIESNKLVIYSSISVTIDSATTNGLSALLGLTENVEYKTVDLHQNKHTIVPGFKTGGANPRPTGSIWFKTTSPNNGANIAVKRMSAAGDWVTVSTPLYALSADFANDPAIAGLATDGVSANTIAPNALYMPYDIANLDTLQMEIVKWDATGIPLTTSGITTSPTLVDGDDFDVIVGGITYTVTLDNAGAGDPLTAAGLATAFGRASIPNMTMTVNTDNTLTIAHSKGNDFVLADGGGSPLAACGITAGLVTNWLTLTYTAGVAEPRTTPVDGTLWYNSLVDEVDIMVHNGSSWTGYHDEFGLTDPLGPVVSATQPEYQSDGVTALATNDLWIDTSDLENYPLIKRYNAGTSTWETINNTDQTTENGVLFADARYRDGDAASDSSDIVDLLDSSYVDSDAPDPDLYPQGMLLFNTRRSGYNVKEYKVNYFDATVTLRDAWVSKVGVKSDGSPYMGRKAQRRVIVEAMQAGLNASLDARQEQNDFTLIACPGYPELLDEMVVLNTDRKGTAFVLVDPPFRLQPTGTDLFNWATNANNAPTNSEEGLVTLNEYSAVFYPNAYTSNLTGEDVMVPASHIMLRTIALNDQVAYPWFAPAGLRRGVVNNATSVGYLSSEGEFVPSPLGQGVRDVMYQNRLNPIVIQPTGGIVVWGQKTLAVTASALDRVNVARLIVYVRKQLEVLVKPYFFEPNDTLTRNEVKQAVETFFNELVGLRALYDFLVVCDTSNNTPERIDRNELWIDIAIKPVKAVEFIYIPIRIKNTGEALA